MLDAITSWATPTTLFLLLNFVIGVIAVTSTLASPRKNQNQNHQQISNQNQQQQPQPQSPSQLGYDSPLSNNRLTRSPSLFSRVTSFNFSSSPLNYYYSSSAPNTPTANAYDYSAAGYNNDNDNSNHHLRSEDDNYDAAEPPQQQPLVAPSSYAGNESSPYTPPQRESRSKSVVAAAPYTPSPQQTKPAVLSSPVSRSPSFLERVTSFNFAFQRSEQQSVAAETVVVQEKKMSKAEQHVERTESEPIRMKWLDADEMLRKTASDMAEAHDDAAQVEEKTGVNKNNNKHKKKRGGGGVVAGGSNKDTTVRFRGGKDKEEELVDAKADDFINRFKQQLRMQKLDSIIRRTESS